jgi:hypothetical protein
MSEASLISEAQTRSGIDIVRLMSELSEIKRKRYPKSKGELTQLEIDYLCLFLSGYSKGEIAYRIRKYEMPTARELQAWADLKNQIRNLKAQMSSTVHAYIKEMLGVNQPYANVPSQKDVILQLKNRGYGIEGIEPSPDRSREFRLLVEEEDVTPAQINDALKKLGINAIVTQVIEG